MKKLLLSLTLMFGSFASFAQLTCATATPITADGTITCPAITTGTYVGTCAANGNGTAPNAVWFTYTATANGEVTISSDLPQNVAPFSDDTRLSVFIGTCTTLQCYAGLDDISDTNYLTNLTFPVASGVTYYIAWDDRWSAAGFDFDFSFAVPACIGANATSVQAPSNVTVDSAQLNWAVGIGNPASYDVLYGDAGFDPLLAGTAVNTVTNSLSLTGLTPASSEKDYFLRNNCGAEQSSYIFAGRRLLGAVNWFLNETKFEYLFLTTTSSLINVNQLISHIKQFDSEIPIYAGHLMGESPNKFVTGSGILMNRITARLIIDKFKEYPYEMLNDVALGMLLLKNGLKPFDIPWLWCKSVEDVLKIDDEALSRAMHFRCKTNSNPRIDSEVMASLHQRLLLLRGKGIGIY